MRQSWMLCSLQIFYINQLRWNALQNGSREDTSTCHCGILLPWNYCKLHQNQGFCVTTRVFLDWLCYLISDYYWFFFNLIFIHVNFTKLIKSFVELTTVYESRLNNIYTLNWSGSQHLKTSHLIGYFIYILLLYCSKIWDILHLIHIFYVR